MLNRKMVNQVNNKKILKKVKKNWVIVSIVSLAFTGVTAVSAASTVVDAAETNTSVSSNNQNSVVTESRTLHEVIKYQYSDGTKAADDYQAEPLTFTRTVTTDPTTGQKTYSRWGGYKTFPPVTSPVIKGYTADDAIFGQQVINANTGDLEFIVTYTKNKQTVATESKTVNEKVHYQYSDGTKAADDYVAQPITFTRSVSTDVVTGEKTYGSWSVSQNFAGVTSPSVKGYTADKLSIGSQAVSGDSGDLAFIVTYNKNISKSKTTVTKENNIDSSTDQATDKAAVTSNADQATDKAAVTANVDQASDKAAVTSNAGQATDKAAVTANADQVTNKAIVTSSTRQSTDKATAPARTDQKRLQKTITLNTIQPAEKEVVVRNDNRVMKATVIALTTDHSTEKKVISSREKQTPKFEKAVINSNTKTLTTEKNTINQNQHFVAHDSVKADKSSVLPNTSNRNNRRIMNINLAITALISLFAFGLFSKVKKEK